MNEYEYLIKLRNITKSPLVLEISRAKLISLKKRLKSFLK